MADDLSRILSADLEDDGDLVIEGTLRPRTLDEYIGQREVKANLSVLLTAARGRGPIQSSLIQPMQSGGRRYPAKVVRLRLFGRNAFSLPHLRTVWTQCYATAGMESYGG
jgi:hypothetical protein